MPTMFAKIRVVPSVDVSAGGMPFHCQAPSAGLALVGLDLRAGEWIDQVTPVFAELLDDGSLGSELYGASYGGHGGTVHQLRVQPGHVVIGLQTRSGSFVDAVRLLQSRWDGSSLALSESTWTPWVGGRGGVERPERTFEPFGSAVAMGIAGRAGAYVDNLTIVGAELLRVPGNIMTTATGTRSSRSTVASG